ncbi:uncharacterized protein PGTG_22423 [Puccinia graminis f. sp. tritici CRL 75-36-700-3]|uniref:Uncharacterized protein n=1 Tax=Puccinia graminis f. sp. tritici (strain CRL 75-36-700-3 / race SCCL) TaxID=418459 RepID=H6QUF3_PUCGT|nr:uncharacterized protein PGTG_22423 [Puccinia graminis f. sp. tritici CRL 75-36-700-3]EHS64614.1 hypothetical protein PGTG_22423 [Puccinia graminis f. sp. tritici CRL 75-36-700-3]
MESAKQDFSSSPQLGKTSYTYTEFNTKDMGSNPTVEFSSDISHQTRLHIRSSMVRQANSTEQRFSYKKKTIGTGCLLPRLDKLCVLIFRSRLKTRFKIAHQKT